MKKRSQKSEATSEKEIPPPVLKTWPGLILRDAAPPDSQAVVMLNARLDEQGRVVDFRFTAVENYSHQAALAAYHVAIRSFLDQQRGQSS